MARERFVNPDSPGGNGRSDEFIPEETSPYTSQSACEAAEDGEDDNVVGEGGMNVNCDTEGTADTADCYWRGWTTSPSEAVTVIGTDHDARGGVWDTDYYHQIVDADQAFYIRMEDWRAVGLQVQVTNQAAGNDIFYINGVASRSPEPTFYISKCILRGSASNVAVDAVYYADADGILQFYNNVVYDFLNSAADSHGINTSAVSSYIYNNTFYDVNFAVRAASGTVVLKNNIGNNLGSGLFDSADAVSALSARNITDHAPDANDWFGTLADSGTCDDTEANKIHDADQNFLTTCKVGYIVKNTTDTTYTYITAVVDDGELTVNDDIFVDTDEYEISENFFKDVAFATAGSDFHLDAAETIAVDNGEDLDPDGDGFLNVTEDFEGDARDASTPDIGADEFTGGATTTSTSSSTTSTTSTTSSTTSSTASTTSSTSSTASTTSSTSSTASTTSSTSSTASTTSSTSTTTTTTSTTSSTTSSTASTTSSTSSTASTTSSTSSTASSTSSTTSSSSSTTTTTSTTTTAGGSTTSSSTTSSTTTTSTSSSTTSSTSSTASTTSSTSSTSSTASTTSSTSSTASTTSSTSSTTSSTTSSSTTTTALGSANMHIFGTTAALNPAHADANLKSVLMEGDLEVREDAFFGGASDYAQIDSGGNVKFFGDAGLCFGEIYVEGIDVGIAMAAESTYYQVEAWSPGGPDGVNGESNGTTPDITNDHITINEAGKYFVRWHVACYSGQKNEYEFEVFINNGDTGFPQTENYRTTSTASAVGSISGGGICDLAANDTIELWAERKDGLAVEKTITIRAATLSVIKIGGT